MLIYVVTKSVEFPLNARHLRNLLQNAYEANKYRVLH